MKKTIAALLRKWANQLDPQGGGGPPPEPPK